MFHAVFVFSALASALVAHAQSFGSPLPAADAMFPLILRTPYFNSWVGITESSLDLALYVWPSFWDSTIIDWCGMIRIDKNSTYQWLGKAFQPGLSIDLTNVSVTATSTTFHITAGPMDLNVSFISPIEPSNLAWQSLAFGYISVDASANDGQPHTVQIYSDITGVPWASPFYGTSDMNWTTYTADPTMMYHQIEPLSPVPMSEFHDLAQDATVYYGMAARPGITWMSDTDTIPRARFYTTGTLPNTTLSVANATDATGHQSVSAFAISIDLGDIVETNGSVVWAFGMVRDPAVTYIAEDGSQQQRSPYWRSQFETSQEAISALLQDYPNGVNRWGNINDNICSGTIVPLKDDFLNCDQLMLLALRQAVGGTELTIGGSSDNQWNTSDVKMFMKDLGSSGRVNPVEGLYASFPAFLYLNASYGGYLLEPVFEFAASSRWSYPYAPRDIGLQYPNATGNNASHSQGVEQSGNMLIMALAHARTSGDGSLISGYYGLLKNWADYLIINTLPLSDGQEDADGQSGNSTNLSLKGIIAIKAMSAISDVCNVPADSAHYANVSSVYAKIWQSEAISSSSPPHVLAHFGDENSWTLAYNLYADKLLQTNVIDQDIYEMQTAYLLDVLSTSEDGVPIDSSQDGLINSVWSYFIAAYMVDTPNAANISNISNLNSLQQPIWTHFSSSDSTLPAVFNVTGNSQSSPASPFVGGLFASHALALSNKTITNIISQPSSTGGAATASASHKPKLGPIIGGTIGGVGGLLVLIAAVILWGRYRQHRRQNLPPQAGAVAEQSHIHPLSSDLAPSTASLEPKIGPTAMRHGGGEYLPSSPEPAPALIASTTNIAPAVSVPARETLMSVDTAAPHLVSQRQ